MWFKKKIRVETLDMANRILLLLSTFLVYICICTGAPITIQKLADHNDLTANEVPYVPEPDPDLLFPRPKLLPKPDPNPIPVGQLLRMRRQFTFGSGFGIPSIASFGQGLNVNPSGPGGQVTATGGSGLNLPNVGGVSQQTSVSGGPQGFQYGKQDGLNIGGFQYGSGTNIGFGGR